MKDLDLWRRLKQKPVVADPPLLRLLDELAQRPMATRAPFLHALWKLREHSDPRLRASAVRVLAGATGHRGLVALNRALDDDDATVRKAAVDAWAQCARGQPWRWAHVVFHRRADVRAQALAADVGDVSAQLGVFLLADPANAELARTAPWPKDDLALVFDLFLRGHIDKAVATQRLAATDVASLRGYLLHGRKRSDAEVDAWLDRCIDTGEIVEARGHDVLDAWRAAWEPAHAAAEDAMDRLRAAVLGERLSKLRRRAAVALLQSGACAATSIGQRDAAPAGLDICIACEPKILGLEGLDVDARRHAAQILLRSGVKPPKVPESGVRALWDTDACRASTAPGAPALHLSTAACVAALLPRRRVAAMCDHYGEAAVVACVARDNAGWMDLCRLPQETKGGALILLDRFRRKDHARYEQLLAMALATWMGPDPKRAHEALGRRVRGTLALRVLLQLLGLLSRGEVDIGEKALLKLLGRLVEKTPEKDARVAVERIVGFHDELDSSVLVFCLRRFAAHLEPTSWALATCGLGPEYLAVLLGWLDDALLVPVDHERALAKALHKHAEPHARAWAKARLETGPVKRAPPKVREGQRNLLDEEVERIATCTDEDLEAAVEPALRVPTGRLCEALARREASENMAVCTALVGAVDPVDEVAGQLERFMPEAAESYAALHASCVAVWQSRSQLPPLAHAVLHRWERHAFAFAGWIEGEGEARGAASIERRVLEMSAWPGEVAKAIVWEAMAAVILLRRYREAPFMPQWGIAAVVHAALQELDTRVGHAAAKVLTALHLAGVATEPLAEIEDAVHEVAPDLDAATRLELARWVAFEGLPARRAPARRRSATLPKDILERIKGCESADELELYCRRGDTRIVHEACLKLVMMGRAGQMRLLALMDVSPALPGLDAFVDSVALWTDAGCVAAVRVVAIDPRRPAAFRFRLCLALADRGERGFLEHALGVLREPVDAAHWGWFHRKLRHRLARVVDDDRRLALTLADAPHPHAYRMAVTWLLEHAPNTEGGGFEDGDISDAMMRFLESGTERPQELRRKVALHLARGGYAKGLEAITLLDLCDPELPSGHPWVQAFKKGERNALVEAALGAALLGGEAACAEARVRQLWAMAGSAPADQERWKRALVDEGSDPNVRSQIVRELEGAGARERKTRLVASVFAWGIRRGRELTGRLFKIHMTDKRADFGYTFLDQQRIYVSALPIFRGDRHGIDIVEGLILHEIGHHMYHAGKEADRVWRRAQRSGLHRVLNLVADEHLERNLRAQDPAYGDRLKRLCAYAFAHSARELQVEAALRMLLGAAFEVLSAEALGVAFDPTCVQVERGALLRELDRRGHAFARFVRALRMGLGDRHEDEQLQRALSLFRGGFRHLDMEGLYEVVLKLAEIYGGSQALAQVFGGHEDLEWEGRDAEAHGSGVSDEGVQREVERILDPKRNKGKPSKGGGRLAINVAADAHFDVIEAIERVAPDRERHRRLAKELRRFANRLREYMMRLGLAHKSMRARLRGRAFDRTRAQAVVIRRDPRMLVAREVKIDTDLFVGVVVDCSGSMSVGGSMEKAHRFGVLIAEAVHRLDGVDARFFGFTDRTIYDAGDAENCAVTSLEATGGNNDAAGLWHVARVAAHSQRRAKLLVMISDGLPTECSVQALRALVQQLGRKGMVCAQVAVRPLEEVCFPHYVVLDDDDMNTSVRKFGEIITKLVGRALGR